MRNFALALLLFSPPLPSHGMEILCKTSFLPSKEHPSMRYGDCRKVDLEYAGSKLRITSTHSVENGGFESVDIDAHTSYSLIPPNSPHLITPDILHIVNKDFSYDTRTHYFESSFGEKITLCSPLLCITIPHSPSLVLRPLNDVPSQSNPCSMRHYLPIGFLDQSVNPAGLCIHSQESPDASYPILETTLSSALYYFSLKKYTKRIFRYNHPKEGDKSTPIKITPSHHTSPFSSSIPSQVLPNSSLSFYSYDLSSHIEPNAAGFSLSHNLYTLFPNKERVYSIKTPTRVYSLLKEKNGGFTLYPEREERENHRFFQEAEEALQLIEEWRAAKKASTGKEEEKEGESLRDEDGLYKKTLILHSFKDSEFFFKGRKDIGPAGRFGALYQHPSSFRDLLDWESEAMGFRSLKRFFDLEKAVGGDWKTIPEGIANSRAGKAVFEMKDLFLYNWLVYLRSEGMKPGTGVYQQWKNWIPIHLHSNWDFEDDMALEPPKVVREMPPLETPLKVEEFNSAVGGNIWTEPEFVVAKNEKKGGEDGKRKEGGKEETKKVDEEGEEEEGFWDRYRGWIGGGCAGVLVVIAIAAFLHSKRAKKQRDPLLI